MVTELLNDWPSRNAEAAPSLIYCYIHATQKYDRHNQVSSAVGSTLADAVAAVSSANRASSENKHTVRRANAYLSYQQSLSNQRSIWRTAESTLQQNKQTMPAAQTLAAQADGTIATLMSFNGWKSSIMRWSNEFLDNESFKTEFKTNKL